MRIFFFLMLLISNFFSYGVVFHQCRETLNEIKSIIDQKKTGMYIRFGDGEINIATGLDHRIQKNNPQLKREMQEAIGIQGENVLKALPLHCREIGGFEPGMFPGNHEWSYQNCLSFIKRVSPFWNGDMVDVYSQVALHFSATNYEKEALNFLNFLRKANCTVFVGNEHTPIYIKELLFGPNCSFVKIPDKHAYGHINRIEKQVLSCISKTSDYQVVVLAMGVSGRPLQKRLWKQCDNLFILDFGSLIDALSGIDSRAWIKLSNFNKDLFLKKLAQKIKVLVSAALIDNQSEMRRREYIASLEKLKKYDFQPYIVEPCKKGKTFLDSYSKHVLYTQTNDFSAKNKGVNEVAAMLAGFKEFNFDSEDMILKMVGRYLLKSDSFIRLIESNPEVDVFIKYNEFGTAWTGCYAMRAKYHERFLQSINLADMERKMQGVEVLITQYIKQIENEGAKIMRVSNLDVRANIFGVGFPQLTNW